MAEASLLKELPFFHSFTEKECAAVIRNAAEKSFKKGEVIFREGKYGDALYIILSGEVAIEKKPLIKTTGALSTLRLRQGDFFGELSLFDSGTRTSTARAIMDTQTMMINQADLLSLFLKKPVLTSRLFKNMLQIIACRVRSINQELMTFYEIGRLLSASYTQNSLLENVLGILIAALDAKYGLILMKNPASENLEIISVKGSAVQKIQETDVANSALIGRVLNEGRPFVTSPGKDKISDAAFINEKIILVVPFGGPEKKNGLVILIGRRKTRAAKTIPMAFFTDNDTALVQAVTSQIEMALENIRFQIESEGRQKLQRHYFAF